MVLAEYSDSKLEEGKLIAQSSGKILISESKSPIRGIKEILVLDGRGDDFSSSILLCSQMGKFRKNAIESSAMREIMDASQNKTAYLLAYSSEQVRERPIQNHQHRAFSVSKKIRNENPNIALDIYNAHNRIKKHNRDITISPSVLMFYLRQGFQITNIYIPTRDVFEQFSNGNKNKTYPQYSLNKNQQSTIYQIIRLFLNKDDLKLPFFVEVERIGTEQNNLYNYQGLSPNTQSYFDELARASKEAFPENDGHLVLDESFRKDIEGFLEFKKGFFSKFKK